jgi:predicted nucleic acid-binding protein
MIAIVDTGPLYAAADTTDQFHRQSVEILSSVAYRFFVPILAAAEAIYLVGSRLGPLAEASFVEGLSDFELVLPTTDDLIRMTELMRTYQSFPLGVVDASVVALSERMSCETLVTIDRRHFTVIRPRHTTAFRLIPE